MKQNLIQLVKSKLRPNKYKKSIDQDSIQTSHNEFKRCNSDLLPKWFKTEFTREDAEEYLKDKEIGVFVIRESETILDCYVLSVKCSKYIHYTGANEISNYLIIKSADGFIIRGNKKKFNDLVSLVTHCSLMRDMLPVLLNLDFYKSESEKKKLNDLFYYSTSTCSSATNSTSSLASVSSAGSI